jgi:hypothetical protein
LKSKQLQKLYWVSRMDGLVIKTTKN